MNDFILVISFLIFSVGIYHFIKTIKDDDDLSFNKGIVCMFSVLFLNFTISCISLSKIGDSLNSNLKQIEENVVHQETASDTINHFTNVTSD